MRAILSGLSLLLLVPACGSSEERGPDDASPAGEVRALFHLPVDGQTDGGFYGLPFPNDLRRTASGAVDLSEHPRLGTAIDGWIAAAAAHADGFSPGAPVFFRFDEDLDVASLPATPADSLAGAASVYLVVVDPDSPAYGERHPVRFRFEPDASPAIGDNWLSVLPVHGMPLDPDTTYAAVVTTRVRGEAGETVVRSPDLDGVLADGGAAAYAPLRDWLDEPGGDEREDVVSAAVFTTRDPTKVMRLARAVVHRDVAAPVARDVVEDTEATTPGYALFTGRYDGPIFQAGTAPYSSLADDGSIPVDPVTGEPVLQGMQAINFAIAMPDGAPPAGGWPVVIYGHGTGGSHRSFHNDGTAELLAAHGLAVLGFEGVLQGARHPDGRDSIGLGFFNFLNPHAFAATWQQGGIDLYQVVRLVRTLPDVDGERIAYFGHSQGTEVGSLALPFEPDIAGAVLSGGAAYITLIMLHKTKPADFGSMMQGQTTDMEVDEFSPLMALVQLAFDPGDPAFSMPLLAARPVAGVAAKDVFLTEGMGDGWGPPLGVEAMAVALRAPPLMPVLMLPAGAALAGLEAVMAPVSANLTGHTVVFAQYEAPADVDAHHVVFHVDAARAQVASFLESLAETGVATVPTPASM